MSRKSAYKQVLSIGTAVDDKGKTPLPAAIESALRELGCGHISPEVTPYIHGNMNQ